MKKQYKSNIVLDFDDTLVKSSEQIISMLNKKYKLNKTIDDLKDFTYASIYKNITKEEITDLYASEEFFQEVKLNDGVINFLNAYKDKYNFIICSKGTKLNLIRKKQFLTKKFPNIEFEFIGIEFKNSEEAFNLNKSGLFIPNILFAVDDNSNALNSINSEFKILINNYRNTEWNKVKPNSNWYIVNDFNQIKDICDFDEQLKKAGTTID